ncbi:NAD(P)H-dependent oxidoreductase [Propionigenium maris DSM 9537]|uniref:NAD(P)H-dependent oxidoreductase n=1 Tax=Propionigenium maris DSM 9537 TaxID=1123000 RepID=A0A9W6GJX7_9FUSO|nr:NAD(P)H-dependent oxidoreductase [Propionigenium maris]GLI55259.1 NAD(P)H-dependent oxidoreductase [Propionigenium maris DSM 9537]
MKKEFIEAMNRRYACKEFDIERRITDEDFNFIMEAGRLSPSSFGFEPWQFLVITDPKMKEEVTEFSWGGRDRATGASHFVVALTRKGEMKHDSEYLNNFMRGVQKLPEEVIEMKTNFFRDFQEKDFNLLENERTLSDWAGKQSYIAMGNMLTAGAIAGVDSCPIEGFHKEKTEKILAEKFDIDMERFALSYMIAFGYAKDPENKFPKTRRGMEDVVRYL